MIEVDWLCGDDFLTDRFVEPEDAADFTESLRRMGFTFVRSGTAGSDKFNTVRQESA